MTSWQKGLKLSVTPFNKIDELSKIFSDSVVWQGSLVFNEVHCFVISSLRGLVFFFNMPYSFHLSFYFTVFFSMCMFLVFIFHDYARINQEPSYQDSVCVVIGARPKLVLVLPEFSQKGLSTLHLLPSD